MSGGWSNSHNIAFRVFDYDYHGCNVYTNGNALPVVQGMANYMIIGDADTLGHCKTFGRWS